MTGTPQHSKLDSPSAASRTEACPGSVALTMHLPDERNAAADAGTLTHWIAAWMLNTDAGDWLKAFPDGFHNCPDVSPDLRVTEEMCAIAQTYVDYCRRESVGAEVTFVEHRVAFNESLGVDGGAEGTIDFVALWPNRVLIADLKAGYTKVMAGSQLKRYALGVREQYGHLADFETFTLAIVQPKLDHIDEVTLTDAELDAYQADAKVSARLVREAVTLQADPTFSDEEWERTFLNPGEEQCKWCKAKAWCPALAKKVREVVGIDDMEDLSKVKKLPTPTGEAVFRAMDWAGLAEDYFKAVRAETEKLLLAGVEDKNWKLVQGRKGARAWVDEQAAEALMRNKFRLKVEEAYDLKLISPTAAEKILGKQVKRWNQLLPLITQSDGKPSVAPVSDKRPAISVAPNADGMEDITESIYG